MRLRNFEKPAKGAGFHGLVIHSITKKGDRIVEKASKQLICVIDYKSLQVSLYRALESHSIQKIDRMANTMRSKKINKMEYYI